MRDNIVYIALSYLLLYFFLFRLIFRGEKKKISLLKYRDGLYLIVRRATNF